MSTTPGPSFSCRLLGLCGLQVFSLTFDVTCEPEGGKNKETNAGADSARVVGPCSAQEAGILVMPGWNNRYGRRRVQERVTMASKNQYIMATLKTLTLVSANRRQT